MSTATAEQTVLDAVKPQLLHRRASGATAARAETLEVEDPATGETLVEVADATVDDAKAALGAADEAFAHVARHARRASAATSCAAPTTSSTERADELALLMTLEMGKPVAESKAEIAYAAKFFRWYSEEAVRINGRFTVNEAGTGRVLTMQAAGRPVRVHHAVELPAGDGHAQDRPGHRGRAARCVVKPAKQTPLSMLHAGPDPGGGRAAGRRAQRHHRVVVGRGHGAADQATRARASCPSPARPRSGAR